MLHSQLLPCPVHVAFADRRTAKARLINVRLISMAMTGFFYTFKRPRTAPLMGMMKYDPIGRHSSYLAASIETFAESIAPTSAVRKKVLFLETKKRSKS